MTSYSTSGTPTVTSKAKGGDVLRSICEKHFRDRELYSGVTAATPIACGILEPPVQISQIGTANRYSAGCQGLTTESIYAPAQSKIECRFSAPSHLLVMYIDGIRRDGETYIEGLSPSRLRNVSNKLTFVPANHAYNEWHEARTPLRIAYLYLDPSKLSRRG